MSIKIIRNTMVEPIECVCPYCKSVFSYNYEDIRRKEVNNFFGSGPTIKFVICPVCKSDVDRSPIVTVKEADK